MKKIRLENASAKEPTRVIALSFQGQAYNLAWQINGLFAANLALSAQPSPAGAALHKGRHGGCCLLLSPLEAKFFKNTQRLRGLNFFIVVKGAEAEKVSSELMQRLPEIAQLQISFAVPDSELKPELLDYFTSQNCF